MKLLVIAYVVGFVLAVALDMLTFHDAFGRYPRRWTTVFMAATWPLAVLRILADVTGVWRIKAKVLK